MNPTSSLSFEGGALHDPMPMLDQRSGLPVLGEVRSSRRLRVFSLLLFVAFFVTLVGAVFLPWQQFIHGAGKVVAFNPLERQVMVEAPLAGRMNKSYVVEGQPVKLGDPMFEIVDNDPNLLANLRQQREGAVARRDSVKQRIESIEAQLRELDLALPLAAKAAQTRLDAATYAARTADLHFDRIKALFEDKRGIASQRDFELAKLERDRNGAELLRAEAELKRAEVDLRVTISSTIAARESAKADLASAEQAIVSAEIAINQTQTQRVTAPRDGIVFRVQVTEGTFLKAGSPLCTIVGETQNHMVELWLNGNDMPLVQAREVDAQGKITRPGSPVRIQFEGWPAIQLIGWPSAAVGTFGGEVVLVDPTDNGKGQFRVLVAEQPDLRHAGTRKERRHDWPGARWLRQGVRANGWVLLQRVPLWYEIWRQVNGFPPTLSEDMIAETAGEKK